MKLSRQRIAYLLKVYSEGKATAVEEQALFTWIELNADQDLVFHHLDQLVASYNPEEALPEVDWDLLYQRVLAEKKESYIPRAPVNMGWFRWVAAAAIVLLIGTGLYFFTSAPTPENKSPGAIASKAKDIAPPNATNAVLTLSNGQKIILDNLGNGKLAMQGQVNVMKMAEGEIVYTGSGGKLEFNTLTNPRGSKVITLVLADGSKVWLNAASSLKYPTAFIGKERKVEISGEAYFEVAPNSKMPFIVEKGQTHIRVLGTHFNVKGYEDEKSLNITLLEGSVGIHSGRDKDVVIRPGEQARVSMNGNLEMTEDVDIAEVMAWKNGEFSFKGVEMESIMREVSRWYDVEIMFENPLTERFYADVSRNTGVSTLLQMLEATKAVHFKIEGRRIRVIPGKS